MYVLSDRHRLELMRQIYYNYFIDSANDLSLLKVEGKFAALESKFQLVGAERGHAEA